jgi:hypothetical protein
MAHKGKTGLDYFSFDVDFHNDEKIEFLSARFGLKGEAIAVRLLCKIYRNGYFLPWGDDEALLFAKRVGDGCQHTFVNDVVFELVKRGFLNESIFNRFSVLTSKNIQERYTEGTTRRLKVNIINEYLLITDELPENVNIIKLNVNISPENVDIFPQSKEKESKEKESISPPVRGEPPGPPKSPKNDFIDNIINCFAEKYEEIRGLKYEITNKGKERSAASKILEIYKGKYPKANTESVLEGLKIYFESCVSITSDDWLNKNMGLPIIIDKFNVINNLLIHGNNKRNIPRSVASRSNEIDRIVDAVFKSKGK